MRENHKDPERCPHCGNIGRTMHVVTRTNYEQTPYSSRFCYVCGQCFAFNLTEKEAEQERLITRTNYEPHR